MSDLVWMFISGYSFRTLLTAARGTPVERASFVVIMVISIVTLWLGVT